MTYVVVRDDDYLLIARATRTRKTRGDATLARRRNDGGAATYGRGSNVYDARGDGMRAGKSRQRDACGTRT
jgi:hypothetical protein